MNTPLLDPTEAEMVRLFGPQWQAIRDLIRRAAVLTAKETKALGAAWDAERGAERGAARYAARDATGALVVRDLIGRHGFTADHYRTLTGPWASVVGPAHPDDIADGLVAK